MMARSLLRPLLELMKGEAVSQRAGLIMPKFLKQVRERRKRGEHVGAAEFLLRVNYMSSIAWASLGLIFLLVRFLLVGTTAAQLDISKRDAPPPRGRPRGPPDNPLPAAPRR